LRQVYLYPARFVKIAQNIEISRNPSKNKSSRMFSESPENGCGNGTHYYLNLSIVKDSSVFL
jgi:hypothetical protein